MQKRESIDLDAETGQLVITKQEYVEVKEAANMEEVKVKLKQELGSIVQQVKGLKKRAEDIKSILTAIEGEPGA